MLLFILSYFLNLTTTYMRTLQKLTTINIIFYCEEDKYSNKTVIKLF